MQNEIKYTIYLPPETNQQIEFLRFKTRHKKNDIVLEALEEYLLKTMVKYPEYKKAKSV